MTDTRQRGDTESRIAGFDAVLEGLFERIRLNSRTLGIALGVVLVLGVAAAAAYEYAKRAEVEALDALAEIEIQFSSAMGAPAGVALVPEPANAALAERARETALTQLEDFLSDYGSSGAAAVAAIRAAEMEVDMGRLEAASERLERLATDLDADDPRRAIALRLRAYVLEEQAQPVAAAEIYERAAEVTTYPARSLVLISAGEAFERAGEYRRAIGSYQQALAIAPDVSQQAGLLRRITMLEYKAAAADSGSDNEHSVK
jgi:predicted negative regulator of RcsB-dependent stress response